MLSIIRSSRRLTLAAVPSLHPECPDAPSHHSFPRGSVTMDHGAKSRPRRRCRVEEGGSRRGVELGRRPHGRSREHARAALSLLRCRCAVVRKPGVRLVGFDPEFLLSIYEQVYLELEEHILITLWFYLLWLVYLLQLMAFSSMEPAAGWGAPRKLWRRLK
uniref:Uncharacterized protein n=3 Tax=Aegilops tauschii subsp. strangulata TaxID=200361 RepID=A0A453L4Q5_AEGTS